MSSLSLQAVPEYQVYRKSACIVDVVATLFARTVDEPQRTPISVTAVLDVSGSMSGRKLSLVLETCKFMVKQMSSHDRLSIVTYDSEVEELSPLVTMSLNKKREIEAKLQGVKAGSTTNLSGGLLKGLSHQLELVVEQGEAEPVRSLLLLTDGLANVGITDKAQLLKCVGNAMDNGQRVQIHTLGFGKDHDEQLLQQIADLGRGNYYFIESPDQIPQAFADVMGGIGSVTAQNVEVQFIKASNEISLQQVFSGFNVADNEDGSKRINFGDMYSEERKDVLLRIQVPKWIADEEEEPLLRVTLSYVDAINAEMKKEELTVSIKRMEEVPAEIEPAADVVDQRCRFEGIEAMKQATKEADEGNLEKAKKILLEAHEHLAKTAESSREARLVLSEMAQVDQLLANKAEYKDYGSKQIRTWTNSHMRQRAGHYRSAFQERTISSYSSVMDPGDNPNVVPQPQAPTTSSAAPSQDSLWMRFMQRFTRSTRQLVPRSEDRGRESQSSQDRFSFHGTRGSYNGRNG